MMDAKKKRLHSNTRYTRTHFPIEKKPERREPTKRNTLRTKKDKFHLLLRGVGSPFFFKGISDGMCQNF